MIWEIFMKNADFFSRINKVVRGYVHNVQSNTLISIVPYYLTNSNHHFAPSKKEYVYVQLDGAKCTFLGVTYIRTKINAQILNKKSQKWLSLFYVRFYKNRIRMYGRIMLIILFSFYFY